MITTSLAALFDRDLLQVSKEISLYRSENDIWRIAPGIANSGGNLALHLVGNLKAFVGNQLGGIPYQRQRDLEFSTKDVPKEELLRMLGETRAIVQQVLGSLPEASLSDPFPMKIWEDQTDTGYTLLRLATHLNYHLGQINYHRRMLDEQA